LPIFKGLYFSIMLNNMTTQAYYIIIKFICCLKDRKKLDAAMLNNLFD
jgi:hypothetical protein